MKKAAAGGRSRGCVAGAAVLAATLCFTADAVPAQGGLRVRLPDLSGLSQSEAKALLQQLARVNVITSHCPGWEISPGEWLLLTATGDKLAARLGLDPVVHDRRYFGRAFRLLEDPRNCDRVGPEARPLLERLVALGGSTGQDGSAAAPPAAAMAPAARDAAPGRDRGNAQSGGRGNGGHGDGRGRSGGNGNGG